MTLPEIEKLAGGFPFKARIYGRYIYTFIGKRPSYIANRMAYETSNENYKNDDFDAWELVETPPRPNMPLKCEILKWV